MKMGLACLMCCGESGHPPQLEPNTLFEHCFDMVARLRLFDFHSDPQALNDFLHGTNEVKQGRGGSRDVNTCLYKEVVSPT